MYLRIIVQYLLDACLYLLGSSYHVVDLASTITVVSPTSTLYTISDLTTEIELSDPLKLHVDLYRYYDVDLLVVGSSVDLVAAARRMWLALRLCCGSAADVARLRLDSLSLCPSSATAVGILSGYVQLYYPLSVAVHRSSQLR